MRERCLFVWLELFSEHCSDISICMVENRECCSINLFELPLHS